MSAREDFHRLWPFFHPEEVLSPDGLRALERGELMIQTAAMNFLSNFRSSIDKPVLVNHGASLRRGYRSAVENAAVRGEEFSRHVQGLAFDITIPGLSVEETAQLAINFGWHGVGRYPKQNFVHVDLRPRLDDRVRLWTR